MEKGGREYRLFVDQLGSVREVVDVASGQVVQELEYDAWGLVVKDTNPGFQPFGFAGGLYDPQTKLVRLGARDYDPTLGRWTAKDPILFAGGDYNLFGYAFTDPVNLVDSTGLCPIVPVSPLYAECARRARARLTERLAECEEQYQACLENCGNCPPPLPDVVITLCRLMCQLRYERCQIGPQLRYRLDILICTQLFTPKPPRPRPLPIPPIGG
jgi:RHS repeat-associated protein